MYIYVGVLRKQIPVNVLEPGFWFRKPAPKAWLGLLYAGFGNPHCEETSAYIPLTRPALSV